MAVSKRAQWQRYIDDALLKTEQVTMAAIHSIDGTRWATSKDFEVSPEQILKIVANITGDSNTLKKGGIKVGKQSYILVHHEPDRSVYGRRGADSGVCIVKTKKAVLVAVYGAGIQSSNCRAVMERMADYLIDFGL